jgi:hypothetical protein
MLQGAFAPTADSCAALLESFMGAAKRTMESLGVKAPAPTVASVQRVVERGAREAGVKVHAVINALRARVRLALRRTRPTATRSRASHTQKRSAGVRRAALKSAGGDSGDDGDGEANLEKLRDCLLSAPGDYNRGVNALPESLAMYTAKLKHAALQVMGTIDAQHLLIPVPGDGGKHLLQLLASGAVKEAVVIARDSQLGWHLGVRDGICLLPGLPTQVRRGGKWAWNANDLWALYFGKNESGFLEAFNRHTGMRGAA